MNYEKLTSDKVNYLIWRYLQEAGFGQAAARLQHDWGLQHHPDDFPFAKHIGPRSLIKLIHYGLKLHRIQTSDKPNAQPFFGQDPDSAITTPKNINSIITTTITSTITRTKSSSPSRKIETTTATTTTPPPPTTTQSVPSTTTTSAKPRNRRNNASTTATNINGKSRSNVIANESMDVDQSSESKNEDDMEIDDEDTSLKKSQDASNLSIIPPTRNGEQVQIIANGLESNDPDHQNEEQQTISSPPPVPTLTNGISIGIQSDKIIELAPLTKVLNTNGIKNSTLSHVEWNSFVSKELPFSLLAIGGKQLGQVWEINKEDSESGNLTDISKATVTSATIGQSLQSLKKVINPRKVINLDVGTEYTLVSLAWSPDGDRLAYSIFSENAGLPQRSLVKTRFDSSDEDYDAFSTLSEAVTNLAWNNAGRYIAGISSTSIIILDTKLGTQFRPLDVEHILFDITWLDKDTLVLCGDSYIAIATIIEPEIAISHVFADIAGTTEWTRLRYDAVSNSIAVVSDTSGDLAVIQATGQAYKNTGAHSSGIVDLMFQPVSNDVIDQPRMLITSATDGSIKVWKCQSGVTLEQSLAMDGISQALSIAFSPDGNTLAVADWDKILFWNIRQGLRPRFKWEARRVDWLSIPNGHTPNGVHHDNNIVMEEAENEAPTLSWSGSGQSLTFAHKDKVRHQICVKGKRTYADYK